MGKELFKKLPFAMLLAPSAALASTTTDVVSQLAGLFYIIVGLAVVASILLLSAGAIMWFVRLGTFPTHRDNAINVMEWSVATLFTLVVSLGIVEFIQTHTSLTLYILSIVILVLLAWVVVTSDIFGSSGEEEEKE